MNSVECYYCGTKITDYRVKSDTTMRLWQDCPTPSCQEYKVSYLFDTFTTVIPESIWVSQTTSINDKAFELVINTFRDMAHINSVNHTTGMSEKICDLPSAPSILTLDNLANKIKTYLVFR